MHPKTSVSAPIEYHNLLVHFLNNLYMSFPGAHQTILDFNAYKNEQILSIVRDLSHSGKFLPFVLQLHPFQNCDTEIWSYFLLLIWTGTRQYFIILYITLLLRKQTENSSEDDKYDNYFVSQLVKVLQVRICDAKVILNQLNEFEWLESHKLEEYQPANKIL